MSEHDEAIERAREGGPNEDGPGLNHADRVEVTPTETEVEVTDADDD